MDLNTKILLFVLLIGLSAFFSGSETALTSISRLRLRNLVEKKKKGSTALMKLKEKPQIMLTTLLIGNNIVNVWASVLITSIFIDIGISHVIAVSTGIGTLALLVFAEITPKAFAAQNNTGFALAVSNPVLWLTKIFYPVTKIFEVFLASINKVMGSKRPDPVVTEEEVKSILTIGEEEGAIKKAEHEMISNVFKFDDRSVDEIMTARRDMQCISADGTVKDLVEASLKSPYSRFPVMKGNKDNIVGIIHLRDALKHIKNKRFDVRIDKLMRKPFVVPESKKLDSLLRAFQKRKEHMAIVIDEHGIILGLVTLEDVVEELVGEIIDETDRVNPEIKRISKKEWEILGKADTDEVNKKVKLKIPESEEYDTMGGFILHHLGRIPKEREKIELKRFTITITEVKDNRILRTRVTRK